MGIPGTFQGLTASSGSAVTGSQEARSKTVPNGGVNTVGTYGTTYTRGSPMSETVQNQFHVDVDDPTRRYSLCCECGTVRFVRAGAVPRGRLRDEGDSPEHIAKMVEHFASSGGNPWWDTREPWLRCIEQLKCRTCGAVTSHAYIRSDESRNFAETVDRSRA